MEARLSFADWLGIVGIAVAVQLSWSESASVGWAAVHGFFAWLYVIYHAIAY